MTTFTRLIMTNHQIAIVSSNFESFNIRLLSAIIMMLSKIEFKTQQDNKRVLNFKSNHFFFSSDLNSIINSFARGIRKRFKHINISDQSTFKSKFFISLTIFISLLSDQRVLKSRSFTPFIFINIIRK